jgi:hypothetical protein
MARCSSEWLPASRPACVDPLCASHRSGTHLHLVRTAFHAVHDHGAQNPACLSRLLRAHGISSARVRQLEPARLAAPFRSAPSRDGASATHHCALCVCPTAVRSGYTGGHHASVGAGTPFASRGHEGALPEPERASGEVRQPLQPVQRPAPSRRRTRRVFVESRDSWSDIPRRVPLAHHDSNRHVATRVHISTTIAPPPSDADELGICSAIPIPVAISGSSSCTGSPFLLVYRCCCGCSGAV